MLAPAEVVAILNQLERGNGDAFRHLVRAYSLSLRSYLASQVHHLADVDDLTQEVFIVAYRNLDRFRRGDDFGAWIKGIARNKLSDHFRSAARRHKAIERFREEVAHAIQTDLDQATAKDDGVSIEALLRCVGRLPEKLRKVVRAGLDGEKPSAVAEELVTTVTAVYNLHYRANQLLRDCLRKELG